MWYPLGIGDEGVKKKKKKGKELQGKKELQKEKEIVTKGKEKNMKIKIVTWKK